MRPLLDALTNYGGLAAYGAYRAVEHNRQMWAWAFGATALLFNPFFPVRLDRKTWAVLDVGGAVLMCVSVVTDQAEVVRKRWNGKRIARADGRVATTVEPPTELDTRRGVPVIDAQVAAVFVCPNQRCGHRNRVPFEHLGGWSAAGSARTNLLSRMSLGTTNALDGQWLPT